MVNTKLMHGRKSQTELFEIGMFLVRLMDTFFREGLVMKWFRTASLTLVSAGVAMSLVSVSKTPAADDPAPTKATAKDDIENRTAGLVESLGTATDLAEKGRNGKWPDALVVAGGILMHADQATGGKFSEEKIDVKDGDGKVVAENTKATSFKDQANALFDEARAMVSGDKDRSKALETQIKEASSPKDRAVVAVTRRVVQTVQVHKEHNLVIPFKVNGPAAITVRGGPNLKFQVYNGNKVLWHYGGPHGTYRYIVNPEGREVRLHVINEGGADESYEVDAN